MSELLSRSRRQRQRLSRLITQRLRRLRRPPQGGHGLRSGAARRRNGTLPFPIGILAFSICRCNWQYVRETTISLTLGKSDRLHPPTKDGTYAFNQFPAA